MGAQTTHVLYDQRDKIKDSVSIPIRIVHTNDEAIITSITKATNRQTRVKPEQLFALEEFPKRLERFFDSYDISKWLYFERRDNQYRTGGAQTKVISFADMIRAFAAMFLNEPHRTTRNFSGLKAKIGKDIFAKDQRMELYYTAAYGLKRIEYHIRNGPLSRDFTPAKFHVLLALRILIAGFEMPNKKAKKSVSYSAKILEELYDQENCESRVVAASKIVESTAEVLKERDKDKDKIPLHRDRIRTEPFTNEVIARARREAS